MEWGIRFPLLFCTPLVGVARGDGSRMLFYIAELTEAKLAPGETCRYCVENKTSPPAVNCELECDRGAAARGKGTYSTNLSTRWFSFEKLYFRVQT